MTKKLKIIVAAILLGIFTGGLQRVGALSGSDYDSYGEEFIVPVVSLGDNYLYIQNNNVDSTAPTLHALSLFTIEPNVGLEQIWDGRQWQPSGASPLTFQIIPQDYSIQNLGGTMHLGIADGLNLQDGVSEGVFYFIVGFVDGTSPAAYRVDFSECLHSAKGDLSGVECRLVTVDGVATYLAYRDGEEIPPEDLSSTPIAEEGITGESDEMSTVVTGVASDNSSLGGGVVAAGIASKNTSGIIPSVENVKNTNTDTKSTLSTANSSDVSSEVNTPVESRAAVSPNATYRSYEWWALLPLLVLLSTVVIYFLIGYIKKRRNEKQKRIARLRL
ncbi:MAG: hypothetical protein ACK5MU_02710 [Candidatus Saccharimonadales bacterium]